MKSKRDYISLADGYKERKNSAGATCTTMAKGIKNGRWSTMRRQSLGTMEELGNEKPE